MKAAAVLPVAPDRAIEAGSYVARFARTAEDLDRILRLRYEIFNLELGEGLDASHVTGRDEDELDGRLHHLMIVTRPGEVVGTYRMQTAEMAASHGGFYAEQEFDLSDLPPAIVAESVEIGRACVARAHRTGRVLHLLWRGLATYLTWTRKHRLFGCCSVTSQDPAVGQAVHLELARRDAQHPSLRVAPRPGFECPETSPASPGHIPALFQSYLHLGARVCGPPAIDRQFKTIDWFVTLAVTEIDPTIYRTFFR